jgi:glutathionylspermidine synthase
MAAADETPDENCHPRRWTCTNEIDDRAFHDLRTRMALSFAKWDPQTGDAETLARFALVLPVQVARQLFKLAESLAAEAFRAEAEMLHDPTAIAGLGMPRPISILLRDAAKRSAMPTPALARVIRFDFHPTADGWRISEANTDVPGGFAESSEFPRLFAEHFDSTEMAGHPGDELAKAILSGMGRSGRRVALLFAPGYTEDLQVTVYLADRLRKHGAEPHIVQPHQIDWRSHHAFLNAGGEKVPIDGIFRFYQGEWLSRRPRRPGWESYFVEGETPTCNPGSALLIESKRFALAWPRLHTPLPSWKKLLPESVDPRAVPRRELGDWVLKPAYCNTGQNIYSPGMCPPRDWQKAYWRARHFPSRWVAQRRFETLPLETPRGRVYPCLGVYTINGRAAGIYGRLAQGPLVDYRATDVAVLIQSEA